MDPRFLGDFGTAGYVPCLEVTAAAYERARREVIRAVHRGLDEYDFSRGVTRIVRRTIPFEGTCLLTFDPSTMLPTGEVVEYGLPTAAMARLSEIELRERDFNKFNVLARGRQRAASLSDATAATWSAACASVSYAGPVVSRTNCGSCAPTELRLGG